MGRRGLKARAFLLWISDVMCVKSGVPGRDATNVLADLWEISLTGKTTRRAA